MKRVAVTFVIDHSTYSDFWREYYGRFFDEVRMLNVNESLKHDWGATTHNLNAVQEDLFKEYDLILFADVDEILVPDPEKFADLGEYLDSKWECGSVRCKGYHIIEKPTDLPLDINKPITEQRQVWLHDPMYDKTVIITKPTVYLNNHHTQGEPEPSEDLVMFHLRDADIQSAKDRVSSLGRTFDTGELEYRRSRAIEIPQKWRVL